MSAQTTQKKKRREGNIAIEKTCRDVFWACTLEEGKGLTSRTSLHV